MQFEFTPRVVARFWTKVDMAGPVPAHRPELGSCWLWVAGTTHNGYGNFSLGWNGPQVRAHRFSWALHFGHIPDGSQVLHACDVRRCVNPAHLWLGTNLDNRRDMTQKGRAAKGTASGMYTHPERRTYGSRNGAFTHPERIPRGEGRPQARLTECAVRVMRREYAKGLATRVQLAARHQVSDRTISDALTGRTWSHIANPYAAAIAERSRHERATALRTRHSAPPSLPQS